MAENTIDSLQIDISANAKTTSNSIDRLIRSMENLQNQVRGFSNIKLNGFTNSMKTLRDSMNGFSGVGNFSKSVTQLQRLSRINFDGMTNTASGIREIASALRSMSGMSVPNLSGLDNLAQSIRKFGGKNISNAVQYLPSIANNLTLFIRDLNSIGGVNFDFTGVANLVQNISRLGGAKATQAAQNLEPLKNYLVQFVTELNSVGSLNFDTTGLSQFVQAVSRLGSKSVTTAAEGNIKNLANALHQMMTVLANAPVASQRVVQLVQSIAQIASSGNAAGSAIRNVSNNLTRYTHSAQTATTTSKGLASAIGRVYATYFMFFRGLSGLGKAIESSMDLTETFNYFSVAMDKVGKDAADSWAEAGYDSAQAYADSFEKRSEELTRKMTGYTFDEEGNSQYVGGRNLGMDPNEVMQYQAMYAQMANSIGLTGETALNTSKALTMLGADWASLRNIDTSEAWTKLASALAGETEAVRQLGVDVTEATLQQTAYKYGIDQTVGSMDRATKIQLTLLSVLDQSRVAWGDMAKTLQSPANQFRVLQANVANLARAIGNIFMPVITTVLPYINAFIIALQRLFQWIGNLLGVETGSFTEAVGGMEDNMGGFADSVDDAASGLGDANDNAKKLKKTVLSFDELNQLNDNDTSTSSGGAGGGLGGIAGNPQLDSAISDLLDEYQKVWDEAFNSMSTRSEELADKISDAFKKIYDRTEPLRESLANLWDAFKPFAQSVGRGLLDFLGDFGNLAINFGNYVVAPVLDDIADALRKIKPKTAEDLGYALGILAAALAGYKTMTWISGIFGSGGVFVKGFAALAQHPYIAIATGIVAVVTALDHFGIIDVDWDLWVDALSDIWSVLKKFVANIGKGLLDFLTSLGKFLTPVLEAAVNGLAGALEFFADALDLIPEPVLQAVGAGVGALATAFLMYKGATGISGIISKIASALGGLLGLSKTYALTTIATNTAAVATSVGGFTAASGVSGILGTLKGAMSGFLGVLTAHPLAALAGGLVALGAAVEGLSRSAADASPLGQYAQAVEDLTAALDEKNTSVAEEIQRIDEYTSGSGAAEARMARDLADEYWNLYDKTDKTILEKERLRDLSDNLIEIIPELSEYIDDETGYLDIQKGTLDELVNKTEEYYKLQAAQDMLVDAYKNQIEADRALAEAKDGVNDAMREYLTNAGLNADAIMELVKAGGELTTQQKAQIEAQGRAITEQQYGVGTAEMLERVLADATTAYNGFNQEVIEAETNLDNANSQLDYLNGYIEQTETSLNSIEYGEFIAKTGNAIDQAGGLWQMGLDGMTQITGEKALEIYQEIQNGVYPQDGQGYYDIGNGIMVSLGNGIASGTPGAVKTIDETVLNSINSELSAGGTQIGYKNGQLTVLSFSQAITDISGVVYNAAHYVGEQSGYGFAKGMQSTEEIIASVTRNTMTIADAVARAALGISSPSKVFEKIGKYTGMGFSNGLPDGFSGAFQYFSKLPTLFSSILGVLNTTFRVAASTSMSAFSESLQDNDIAHQCQLIVQKISNIFGELYTIGRESMIGFRNGILSINIPLPRFKINSQQVKIGNTSVSVPVIDFDWYANSGLVNGEIWGMNELGNPEMIGRVGRGSSRTAVANNAIISEAIEGAVERAMSRALMNNGQMNPEVTVYAELTTDDEVLARAVTRGQSKIDYRTNPMKKF